MTEIVTHGRPWSRLLPLLTLLASALLTSTACDRAQETAASTNATPMTPASLSATSSADSRLVTLGGGVSEIVVALEHGDRVVGTDASSGDVPALQKNAAGGLLPQDQRRGRDRARSHACDRERGIGASSSGRSASPRRDRDHAHQGAGERRGRHREDRAHRRASRRGRARSGHLGKAQGGSGERPRERATRRKRARWDARSLSTRAARAC